MKSAQQAQPKKQLSAMIQQPYIVYRGGERGTHHSGGEEPLDESRGEEVRAGLTPWSLELRATMTDDGVGVGGVGGGRRGWRPTRGRPWRGGPCRSRRWRATAAALAGGRRWIRRRRLQQIGGRGGVRIQPMLWVLGTECVVMHVNKWTKNDSYLKKLADAMNGVLPMPGMNLAGTDVPTPGVTTPAPARDECLETLIIPMGRGETSVRPPVAT
uniref:Retrotransposon protein, putative, unclassified n=1 Tax=Oryza sativa subsp. japonica TaxID=39947 RepID=Q2QNV9_ORYSJ|nr:retrotransposon protein, putative, unclassified [Oryza sativa Japonica Group]